MMFPINMYKFKKKNIFLNNPVSKEEIIKKIRKKKADLG